MKLKGLEIFEQAEDQAFFVDTVFADTAVLVGIDGAAFGTFGIELLEDGVILGYFFALYGLFPDVDKSKKPTLTGIRTETDNFRFTLARDILAEKLVFLFFHIALRGKRFGNTVGEQRV